MAGRRKANGEGTVFQRLDGRWQGAGYVYASDGSRKRVYVYGDTRKEANDKLADKLADSSRGVVVAKDPNLTIGEYLAHWLETMAKPRIRETTFRTYEGLVRRFLIPGLGSRKLGTLTVKDVRNLARPHRQGLPVLRPGLGRQTQSGQPAQGIEAALLRDRQVLQQNHPPRHRPLHPRRLVRRAG